jgi:hypothetical protein
MFADAANGSRKDGAIEHSSRRAGRGRWHHTIQSALDALEKKQNVFHLVYQAIGILTMNWNWITTQSANQVEVVRFTES